VRAPQGAERPAEVAERRRRQRLAQPVLEFGVEHRTAGRQ
jgi:hypothetical protein